ncbi:HAEPLYID family protein [Lewinella sp. IMCC34183]|uniref:HAEPLYID family protein n=1 Tax=Lewinella sp. IMCC34183 TaxID=2248762 RepID=UPI000E270E26|nr:HAEPLYID family protein [Lewinella sp. IMCC34183]
MQFKFILCSALALSLSPFVYAQTEDSRTDSLYIQEVEQDLPPKVLHAEPLYIDLIRDLGARQGEREWNLGFGLTDNQDFDAYEALVEYEWAPINRLGLEVELPFTFYSPVNGTEGELVPANRLQSLKVAAQWSFFVNERMATSAAIGYINEFELGDFSQFGRPLITGNVYNPFLIVAKRWGSNWHTLVYTGPQVSHHYTTDAWHTVYEINSNLHYMIPGTRNFIGVEFNKVLDHGDFDMTIRPQMRVGVTENLMVGIVAGIPVSRENERFSSFLRLIYEPGAAGPGK